MSCWSVFGALAGMEHSDALIALRTDTTAHKRRQSSVRWPWTLWSEGVANGQQPSKRRSSVPLARKLRALAGRPAKGAKERTYGRRGRGDRRSGIEAR